MDNILPFKTVHNKPSILCDFDDRALNPRTLDMSLLSSNDLERIFEKLDKNGDGQLSLEELNWLLETIGVELSLHELKSHVGKPELDFDEFLFFYKSISTPKSESSDEEDDGDLVKAFDVFDVNGDGYISCEELESVLRRLGMMEGNSKLDCRSMIRFYDTNLDGRLDFQEFKHMMLKNTVS